MVIYVDLVFLINFILDFLLLLTVNIALKRYSHIYKLFLAALFGSLSLLSLFIPLNSITLSFLKLVMGLIMCLIAFGYKNIKYTFYNVLYLYMTSIILGGFLYYLKNRFSYKNNGLVFIYEGLSINYVVLLFMAPFILYIFIKSIKILKEIKNYYYKVNIILGDYNLTLTGFLDTGNKLKDPTTKKAIILINRKVLKGDFKIRSPMYVPYNSLNNHGLLEVIKPTKIIINNTTLNNYLIGLSDTNFKLNGIDCLLNYQILEDIHD